MTTQSERLAKAKADRDAAWKRLQNPDLLLSADEHAEAKTKMINAHQRMLLIAAEVDR